ncbi:efflux RND transporter permease subunit [Chryseosolibacter indicus]|uniref:Efflux RND transporter permease subunit n=1 Tax=Chryseosolibacter indicus TaxID=2782351 RepID=A0ABS5VQG7_9BACT|nr:efflux RND transporter permease subunit [Chryseosolibacter indicus]MBT1703391.1 efflux RND transporter permease subunit [Chryseosolibacter indicus]
MNLSELSLKRPVLAIVMNIIIVIFGLIGYNFLGVRDYPAIDPPVISVRTAYSGANADIIESQITEPLEKSINGIAGIKNISSNSSQGSSSINIEFELGIDLEAAANDVRDKVSQAIRQLPQDLDSSPEVSKADASTDYIISLTVQSNTRNQLELTEYANNVLVERLQTIPGVSSTRILGEKKYAMRIWLDPGKLSAYGLTPLDVQDALRRQNVELPSGKISGSSTDLTVRTFGRLYTEDDFNNVRIRTTATGTVRLRDVGEAVLGPENEEIILKGRLVPMVGVALNPLPGANYVAIADEFYKRLEKIKKEVPDDIILTVATDQTVFIKRAISEVEETLIISFVLVVLIVYLFFRDFIIAIRPLIDIPVSLIATFFIMYLMGFSINVLTMLGIVLATGLVVDDGIVVTENIYKKLEGGMNKLDAAREGSKEIYFAVIATSITLAVVFLPIIFLQGFVGRLFREFGFVVAGAVLISCFVSLTLTPVLSVKLTRDHRKKSKFYTVTEQFFTGMENIYQRSLTTFMNWRWLALVILIICIATSYILMQNLQSELAPLEDRNLRLQVSAPEGTSFDYMEPYVDEITTFLMDSIPEANIIYSLTGAAGGGTGGTNNGMVRVFLNDPFERERSQQDVVNMVNRNLSRFSVGRAYAAQEQTISTNKRPGQPIQFVIQNNNFEKLKQVLPQFINEANDHPVLQNADADLKFNKPELQVIINRLKATELGVSPEDISQTLQLAYSNLRFGYFTKEGKQYQVIGQVDRGNRDDPNDLKSLYVRTASGQLVSLDNFVSLEESSTPPSLYHFNRYKSATISAGLEQGRTIGDGVKAMEEIASKLLDDTFTTSLSGSSRDFAESSGNTTFAFLLALGLIYLVLAAQFESFIDPLVIMITVPLAITGALLALFICGQTLNIFSQIGIIMLIGLVTKNGILIVEFANQKQEEEGLSKNMAVIEASKLRLRPILMTSLAMALGSLPLALSLGAASSSRVPLGLVIVGGVIFSLVLTLFVIPAMYSCLSKQKKHQERDNVQKVIIAEDLV